MRLNLIAAATLAVLLTVCASVSAQFTTPDRQFHNATSFPLDGRHRTVECASCHLNEVYKGTPTTCFDCHWERRQDDRYRLQLGSQCEQCHRTSNWTDVRWDHGAMTSLTLNGAHRQVECASCHRDGVFKKSDVTCASCHLPAYQATTTPNHAAAGFPLSCETCHKASDPSFRGVRFEHETVFALVGSHAQQPCTSCHVNNVFKGTPTTCVGCHVDEYNRTTTPNHAAAGFPTNCESCHRNADPTWRGRGFEHAAVYPLVGSHAQQACATCHVNNVFKGTPTTCVGCHVDEYNRTTTPNHASAGFSTNCESCHRNSDPTWRNSGFNHASVFALVGSHAQQQCATCHVNNVFKGTPTTCVGCHVDEYNRTTTPNHASAGFPTNCESCHRNSDPTWRGNGFNHAAVFPLAGVHAQQQCATCHVNNVFKGTPTTCVGCHIDEYNRTTAPNHASAGFPTNCESCHRNSDPTWRGNGFNHAAVFPLAGVHAQQQCATCHVNNVFKGTPRTCVGCHVDEYNRTTTPNHASAGFSTNCESCHRNSDPSWRGTAFNHAAVFPLAGVHAQQQCATCHVNNVFKGTPTTCVGCHIDEYNRTTAPNHASAGFPTNCESCHRNSDPNWRQGVFNHRFPITSGPHRQSCETCHTTPTNARAFTCLVCHEHSRTRMDDKHRGRAGYVYDSLACVSCHPTGRE